jgi:acetyl-CoA carboxylase, biotin carboxylase subunit
VPIFYDPLISKLSAWGFDRAEAISRMKRALAEYEVFGIRTTVPFFRWLLDEPAFQTASFHTAYLDELLQQRHGARFENPGDEEQQVAAVAAALHAVAAAGGTVTETSAALPRRPIPARFDRQAIGKAGWKHVARTEGLRP